MGHVEKESDLCDGLFRVRRKVFSRTSPILDWCAGLRPERALAPQYGEEAFKESPAETNVVSAK